LPKLELVENLDSMQPLPRIEQSPTAPDFVANPYPFFERARRLGDFVFWEDYAMPMATSHEAVNAVLKSPAMGREVPRQERSARPSHLVAFNRIDDHSLMRLEPPEHTRLRYIVEQALVGDAFFEMAPSISRRCDALIDGLPRGVPFNAQSAFADQIADFTIMHFLGLPIEMFTDVQTWARQMSALQYARRNRAIEDTANQAATAFTAFMEAHLSERTDGHDDFIGHILSLNKTLTIIEIVSMVLLFIQASSQGCAFTLGHALRHLIGFSDRTLALGPDNITQTFSECVRIEAPLQIISRFAQQEVTLLDHTFERHTQIGCLLGSACRDDAVWPDANVFDPFRASRSHAGFGGGIHACVGASFSAMVSAIALPAFFSRCPDVRLVELPTYANDFLFRRTETLMLEI
jgi:unspecific monooxygenase